MYAMDLNLMYYEFITLLLSKRIDFVVLICIMYEQPNQSIYQNEALNVFSEATSNH